jgi:hypothetical protein
MMNDDVLTSPMEDGSKATLDVAEGPVDGDVPLTTDRAGKDPDDVKMTMKSQFSNGGRVMTEHQTSC